MPSSLPFRLARTAVFAVVCLSLGMVAHSLAGGSVPGLGHGGRVLRGRRGCVPAGRAGAGPAGDPGAAGRSAARPARDVLALPRRLPPAAGAAHAAHASAGLAPDLGMFVAHGWAVGLTALWLARGEAALWGAAAPPGRTARHRAAAGAGDAVRRAAPRRAAGAALGDPPACRQRARAARGHRNPLTFFSDDRRPGDFRRGRRKACP
ncbi:hypothetical protein ACFSTC_58385 [Nonomuraea ferruginea]